MSRKKISGARGAGLVQKDKPDNSPRTCKSVSRDHASYEEVYTQEYDTACKDNDVKQKWKGSAQEDEFVKELKATVGHSKRVTHLRPAKELAKSLLKRSLPRAAAPRGS